MPCGSEPRSAVQPVALAAGPACQYRERSRNVGQFAHVRPALRAADPHRRTGDDGLTLRPSGRCHDQDLSNGHIPEQMRLRRTLPSPSATLHHRFHTPAASSTGRTRRGEGRLHPDHGQLRTDRGARVVSGRADVGEHDIFRLAGRACDDDGWLVPRERRLTIPREQARVALDGDRAEMPQIERRDRLWLQPFSHRHHGRVHEPQRSAR